MVRDTNGRVAVRTRTAAIPTLPLVAFGLTVCLWLGLGLAARAGDGVVTSYGFSNFGALKYQADFDHLDYVNPDAPKGGEISIWAQGSFDSFNQYARDGVPAALNTIGSAANLTSTADDPYGLYCFLCPAQE